MVSTPKINNITMIRYRPLSSVLILSLALFSSLAARAYTLVITENSSTDISAVYNGAELDFTNFGTGFGANVSDLPLNMFFRLSWEVADGSGLQNWVDVFGPLPTFPGMPPSKGSIYFQTDKAPGAPGAANGVTQTIQGFSITVIDNRGSRAVPDASSTFGLMALSLGGLIALRRRFVK